MKERSPVHWLIPLMASGARVRAQPSQEAAASSGLLHGWPGAGSSGQVLLPAPLLDLKWNSQDSNQPSYELSVLIRMVLVTAAAIIHVAYWGVMKCGE